MNALMCYKETEIDSHGKLKFFLEKHSTKEGTWGQLFVEEGEIDFVFLNGKGEELARTRMDAAHPQLQIPPGAWHKIVPVREPFKATLAFYCTPQRYFNKKYGLGTVHNDLNYVYQTYLHHLENAAILDVGCGSGRNLLYLAKMGHQVLGLDHNSSALQSLQEIIQKENLSGANTALCDLNQPLQLEPESYDLVFSTVTLQFLNPQCIAGLIAALQAATRKNGYHFLVFPVQSELYALPDSFTYLPQKEALYHLYQDSGWSILEYGESVGHLHKKDAQGRAIGGMFGLLMAQKVC